MRATERAVIGDQLRRPVVWCQLSPCISRHADPDALGEADARARAVRAGWREDRFGRLVCPRCQQSSGHFWATHQVALWDRELAVIMTSLMTAALSEDAAGEAQAETGVLPAAPAAGAGGLPAEPAAGAGGLPAEPAAGAGGLPAAPAAPLVPLPPAQGEGDDPPAPPTPPGTGRHRRTR